MNFIETKAYNTILDFLKEITNSIRTEKQYKNEFIQNEIKSISAILYKIKPNKKVHRFGNTAFQLFYDQLPYDIYLKESFGNRTRIDYGTGHELNFICYLYAMYKKNIIKINEIFHSCDLYFDLVRQVINRYTLEPAGSHGVWGINDYQILPFLLGANELFYSQCTFEDLLLEENKDLMFAKALKFVKKEGVDFNIHSPLLYDLRLKPWASACIELWQRYLKDVLESKAVTQHFIFGKYLENEQQ